MTPLGRRIDEIVAAGRRAPQGRLARERRHPPARAARLVHHHPQVLAHAAHPREAHPIRRDHRSHGALPHALGHGEARTSSSRAAPAPGRRRSSTCLSGVIPPDERIVTIEDAAELQLKQPHVVSLETRPPNIEGSGEYTIRDLVKNALRMRPDRIVVGECRGGEALDMLQAMNTGHDGSLTTTHANSPLRGDRAPRDARPHGRTRPPAARDPRADRGERPPHRPAVAASPTAAARSPPSARSPGSATTATSRCARSSSSCAPAPAPSGKVIGEYRATGYLPSYLQDFIVMGLVKPGEPYL